MQQASILRSPRPRIHNTARADAPAFSPVHAYAMLSDRGRVRHANQDACGARPERGVFVVCDGIGGAAGGDVASHLAMEAFLDALEIWDQPGAAQLRRIPPKAASGGASTRAAGAAAARNPRNNVEGQGSSEYPADHPHARLEEAVRAANHAVYRHSQRSRALRGMGTTLVGVLLDYAAMAGEDSGAGTPTLWLAHVGDSRCYRLRSGVLRQLTQDHSLVEEQIQAGLLSRVQAGSSPIRNIITRAIGSLPTVEPEIASHPAQRGDLYLLASDGLTRELEDAEISRILCRMAGTATLAAATRKPAGSDEPGLHSGAEATLGYTCQALVDAANAKGGSDNITVLLVHIG